MNEVPITLTILRFAGFLAAAVFLWFVGRAYWKHRVPSMAILFIAIGLLAVGTVIEGILYGVLGVDIDIAHIVEAAFQLTAFVVLVWSVVSHKVE